MKCETVKISDGKDSYIIINKEDFDAKKHELYSEDKPVKKAVKKKAK